VNQGVQAAGLTPSAINRACGLRRRRQIGVDGEETLVDNRRRTGAEDTRNGRSRIQKRFGDGAAQPPLAPVIRITRSVNSSMLSC